MCKRPYQHLRDRGVATISKSTPIGSVDTSVQPVWLAIDAEATFGGRALDSDRQGLTKVLSPPPSTGAALVATYQHCPIFNDGAFDALKEPAARDQRLIRLRQGEPIRFGTDSHLGSPAMGTLAT